MGKKLGSPENASPVSESDASFSFWKKNDTNIFFENIFANICRPLSAFIRIQITFIWSYSWQSRSQYFFLDLNNNSFHYHGDLIKKYKPKSKLSQILFGAS